MTTTVDLNDRELRDLCEVTQQTDVALAVRTAMTEYIRYVRRQQLKELSGKVEMDDNWRQLEAAEVRELKNITPPAGAADGQ